jgi:predicted nucleotidyltransferase
MYIIKNLKETFEITPVSSIILTGGLALGAFSKEMSDIDIVIIIKDPLHKNKKLFIQQLKKIQKLKYGNKVDLKFIEEKELKKAYPISKNLDGSTYRLHEIDLILLKKYSKLLYGKDYRKLIKKYDEKTEIPKTIKHISKKMLPSALKKVKNSKSQKVIDEIIIPYTFLMSRSIYSLYNNKLTTKPESAKWIKKNLKKYPYLKDLSELASEFAGWYKKGKPEKLDLKDLKSRFFRAVESFCFQLDILPYFKQNTPCSTSE